MGGSAVGGSAVAKMCGKLFGGGAVVGSYTFGRAVVQLYWGPVWGNCVCWNRIWGSCGRQLGGGGGERLEDPVSLIVSL